MTDGLYIDTRQIPYSSGQVLTPAHGSDVVAPPDAIDLDTFSMQIENSPTIFTHASLLELIANDLYRRRNYPTIAGAIKHAAKDLQAMAR